MCAQVRFDQQRNVPGPLTRVELHRNRRASITSAEHGDTERSRQRWQRRGARLLLTHQLERKDTQALHTHTQKKRSGPCHLPTTPASAAAAQKTRRAEPLGGQLEVLTFTHAKVKCADGDAIKVYAGKEMASLKQRHVLCCCCWRP